jgi:integrase
LDLRRRANGHWQVRWREGGQRRARTFDRKRDAQDFIAWLRRRRQLGQAAVPDDVPLSEFVETYWRLHAVPNLAPSTRDFYARAWVNHLMPRLGDYGVRELTPRRLARFREELERAGVGAATIRKTMAILQSILSFAISEELVEFNAAASVRKPRYQRRREPHIFLPTEVERIRAKLDLRDSTIISVLAYSGPRPEEVVFRLSWEDIGERAIRFHDEKRHRVRFTPLLAPLAEDLREWFLASGQPERKLPVFPAHDGGFWNIDDWRNWRRRVWQGEERPSDKRKQTPTYPGCAPAGTRPRDLRSSFITLQIYAGVPLTTISKQCGTGLTMIEQHYAGVIENWDGKQVPAEDQIRAARAAVGRKMDAPSPLPAQPLNPDRPANTAKADARTRTGDPFITSEVLYQLSYVGACSDSVAWPLPTTAFKLTSDGGRVHTVLGGA